jgi:hypothetical protein
MTKLLGVTILGLTWLGFIWLAFSFALWDLNPGNWSELSRIACAILGFFPPLFLAPQMWYDL